MRRALCRSRLSSSLTLLACCPHSALPTARELFRGAWFRENEEHQHHLTREVLNSSVQELTAKATEYIVDWVNARRKSIRLLFPRMMPTFFSQPEGTPTSPSSGETTRSKASKAGRHPGQPCTHLTHPFGLRLSRAAGSPASHSRHALHCVMALSSERKVGS